MNGSQTLGSLEAVINPITTICYGVTVKIRQMIVVDLKRCNQMRREETAGRQHDNRMIVCGR